MKKLFAIAFCVTIHAAAGPAWAQDRYDDHELTDRFYITLGGFQQSDLRTTLQLNVKTPAGGIAAGTVILLESLFEVKDQVSTVRLDGWYRLNPRHRLNWTLWSTERDGLSTYNQPDSITIGEITIAPGDSIMTTDKSTLFAVSYSYSFLNTSKFEAWLGGGLNFQSLDTTIVVDIGGGGVQTLEEEAKGTVPIPTIEFGGRWNFTKKLRMILTQELFGLKVGDFEGKLNNTRILAEYGITKRFGIGGGFERFSFEVDAERENFLGSFDTSYTGLSLYLKGQF